MEPAPGHLQKEGETSELHGQLAEPEASAPESFMDRRGSSLRIDAAPFVPSQVCGLQPSTPHTAACRSAVLQRVISFELSGMLRADHSNNLSCLQTQLEPSLPKLNTARSNVYRTLDSGQCCSRGRPRFWEVPSSVC